MTHVGQGTMVATASAMPAATSAVKRSKPTAPPPPRQHKHGPNAYVAKILSLGEVWRVVQAGVGPDAVVAWVVDQQLGSG